MLQACLNGGRRAEDCPGVPETPATLAADAKAAVAAGASCLHIHPRDADGEETLANGPVSAAIRAIRDAVPDIPVGVGTGAWIAPGGKKRHADIRSWAVTPDYASLNVHEEDAGAVATILTEIGVAIEAGIWTRDDVALFPEKFAASQCCRILVEIDDLEAEAAVEETRVILEGLDRLDTGLPVLLHGSELSTWPLIHEAAKRGLDTRIGFEDTTTLPDGSAARDNAALVTAAMDILRR